MVFDSGFVPASASASVANQVTLGGVMTISSNVAPSLKVWLASPVGVGGGVHKIVTVTAKGSLKQPPTIFTAQ